MDIIIDNVNVSVSFVGDQLKSHEQPEPPILVELRDKLGVYKDELAVANKKIREQVEEIKVLKKNSDVTQLRGCIKQKDQYIAYLKEKLNCNNEVLSQDVKRYIKKRDNYMCLKCGSTDAKSLTVDHATPRVLGGSNHESNLQTLCEKCNLEKADNIENYLYTPVYQSKYDIFEECVDDLFCLDPNRFITNSDLRENIKSWYDTKRAIFLDDRDVSSQKIRRDFSEHGIVKKQVQSVWVYSGINYKR